MATGLACLELLKIIQKKKIEAYRNTFANLALPLFAMAEPIPAKEITFNDLKWSLWDRWELEGTADDRFVFFTVRYGVCIGDLTVQNIVDYFKERKLECYR